MNTAILTLAKKKWFVPLVIFLMLIIALSALEDSGTNSGTTKEASVSEELESLCNSVAGVRNAKVMITYEAETVSVFYSGSSAPRKIIGIAVVCDGGNDPAVQLSLHRLIRSLFDVSSTRITVTQRNRE